VSTFGPEGPTKCSGLEVMRYGAESLHREVGGRFRPIESSKELHRTPFGTRNSFSTAIAGSSKAQQLPMIP
jgi:hypothetical protein